MTQWHWDPDTYLANMLEEVPAFEELQEQTAAATAGDANDLLELGIGTGETARRVLTRHPKASLTAIDSSAEMVERAKAALPDGDIRIGRLEDPLPQGPFDVVYSTLTVHHLDGPGKRDLFARVAAILKQGGRFVLGDVVVSEDPSDQQTPIDGVMDLPDRLDDQLAWLREAGLTPEPVWTYKDLAVIRASAN